MQEGKLHNPGDLSAFHAQTEVIFACRWMCSYTRSSVIDHPRARNRTEDSRKRVRSRYDGGHESHGSEGLPLHALALVVEERAAVLGREGADNLEHAADADGDGRRRTRSSHIYTCPARKPRQQ